MRIFITFFETNCDGNSALKNASRKTVLPKLKSFVFILRSGRKLSVFAWERLPRSRLSCVSICVSGGLN